MADNTPDLAQSILAPTNLPDNAKADAWDAFNSSTSADDLATKLQDPKFSGLADDVKAKLWDAKNAPTPQPSQSQEQPGFLQRAYETSPLPGIINAGQQAIQHFVDAPTQHENDLHDMVGALGAGDLRGAASKAAKLLTGSESPFSDAAKSVVKLYVDDAKQNYQKLKGGNLSDIPAGNAATNYIKDVKSGNTAGAIGDVVGGVSSVAPMLLGDETTAAKAGDIAGKVSDAAGVPQAKAFVADTLNKAKPLVSEDAAAAKAQPAVQSAVRGAAEDVAADEAVTPKASPSVRDAVKNVGDEVMGRSKAAFQQLDEASGGRWQRFDDQLSNLRDKMDEVSGIDDDAYEKFDQKAKDVEAAQSDLVDSLVRDGKIDPDLAEAAKNDYKQASALYDLSQQVRSSASGLRPEIGEGTPETVDPSKLGPRLNKLYDSGRLQQALGEDGAADLVKQVDSALRSKASAVKTAKIVKSVVKGAGILGTAGIIGHGAAAILGGH